VGSCNYFEVLSNGKRWRAHASPLSTLQPGDQIKEVTGGGGGCGDPLTRPARRFEDVPMAISLLRQARSVRRVVRPDETWTSPQPRKLRRGLMERARVADGL